MIQPLRVLLLDDDPLVHITLCVLLGNTPDLRLIGATANVAELPVLCAQTEPHILLLGGSPALWREVGLLIEPICPQIQLIALLNLADPLPLPEIRLAGCCRKAEINEGIVHLLRATMAGVTWVSGGVAAQWRTQTTELVDACPRADLTPVEQTVYALLGRGWKNKQIAAHLHCTPQTVCNYNSHIYKKLGLNREELIVAFQSNLKKS